MVSVFLFQALLLYEPGNLTGSVTGQEQNFVSVHMENFTPINKDEIQETN